MNDRRKQWAQRRAQEVRVYKAGGKTKLSSGAIAVNPAKAVAAQKKLRPVVTSDGEEELGY
jgi:hypothetical protein